MENDLGLVKGHDDRDGVGFEEGEAREEEQICWIGFALPIGEEHEADSTKELFILGFVSHALDWKTTYRNPDSPLITLNPSTI